MTESKRPVVEVLIVDFATLEQLEEGLGLCRLLGMPGDSPVDANSIPSTRVSVRAFMDRLIGSDGATESPLGAQS